MKFKLTTGELRQLLNAKLSHNLSVTPETATENQIYTALVLVTRELLQKARTDYMAENDKKGGKQVYYLCMEFLMGRSLKNNLFNLGLTENVKSVLKDIDVDLNRVFECEPDAGLGNGGLGRLAACFLDGLATQGYPAMGYSLRYEFGIFRQKLIEGWQTELPDFWLPGGEVWLEQHPESSVSVNFDGYVDESWDGDYHKIEQKDCRKIEAIPCDLMTAGYGGQGVSVLRLWKAKTAEFDMTKFNDGDYMKVLEQNAMAEMITKVLYPGDNHLEGKSLRLSQQYFLCSATIQDIVHSHLSKFGTLENFAEKISIHLNDTHPVLAIPELMRIFLDECGYSWEKAWEIVTSTVAYTNHTVMAEALECWQEDLFKRRLPRIYQIVCEINKRFCQDLEVKTYGNQAMVSRMSIVSNGVIKMANLAVAGSHSVNGVSKLHSDILKESVFHDFYLVTPDKFKNVTNGIAHRRWLNQSNPELATFLTNTIGNEFTTNASALTKLNAYADDKQVLADLEAIKRKKKEQFAKYVLKNNGIKLNIDSVFDVQVKRLHEYKRQLLNGLDILATYQYLRENPNANFTPRTYIFGAKAAPGYYFAKEIIRFLITLGNVINNDPIIGDKMKVVYLEDYRVTVAEKLMPAADISEQISLAGTEASGTGNMKLMINGALTLGTMDGANVEIFDAVGADNIFIFGMSTPEVNEMQRNGYNPRMYYNNNPVIKQAIDELYKGIGGLDCTSIANSLVNVDPYMVLADYADYKVKRDLSGEVFKDRIAWNKMSLANTANAGIFASDRSIDDYANTIWGAKSILK